MGRWYHFVWGCIDYLEFGEGAYQALANWLQFQEFYMLICFCHYCLVFVVEKRTIGYFATDVV